MVKDKMYDPELDGIGHINIYSQGKTSLGQFLSNFSYFPLKTEDGEFKSIEGYWYWLLSKDSERKDELRTVFGFKAKELGRKLSEGSDWADREDIDFQNKIKNAIKYKTDNCTPQMKRQFKESVLPFAHYYVYKDKIKLPSGGGWIIEYFEKLRKDINNDSR